MKPKAIIILVIALLVLVILAQNTQDVTLQFLFWSVTLPQFLCMAITVLLGFAAGYLVCLLSHRKKNIGP